LTSNKRALLPSGRPLPDIHTEKFPISKPDNLQTIHGHLLSLIQK